MVRNPEAREAGSGDLAVSGRAGQSIALEASDDTRLLLMTGQPIPEPVVGQGPSVMNSRAEILQAFEDYQLGKLGTLD
jgi:redox-sensitive bicupin YhaK (pirin superfamily)